MDNTVPSETGAGSSADSSNVAVHAHRPLTAEEEESLKYQDTRKISERRQSQLESEARKHWDLFYKRNSTKFFKDRHWTLREFQELSGVGLDNPQFDASRCHPFCCDVTADSLTSYIAESAADIATIIFCLSAIHPGKMVAVLENVYTVLRPGGCVLVRDYGLYDHAMLRFTPGHKLADSFYVRQDGTRAYYFSTEKLDKLFTSAGFRVAKSEYVFRRTVNRKAEIDVQRVFVQGKYVKPSCAVSDV